VVLADHTKLGTDTMFQTVPTDVITRLVTDEPPAHNDRALTELQALADQGVQIAVAGPGPGSGPAGGDGRPAAPGRQQPRRRGPPPAGGAEEGLPLPGPRRNHPHPPGAGPGPGATLRGAMPLAEQPGPGGGRVADLAPRRR